MLNDGATCASEDHRDIYAAESSRVRNAKPVRLEGCHLALVATRDVQAGEELLLTYGAPFWLAQLGVVSRRPRRARRRRGTFEEEGEDDDDDGGGGSSHRRPRRGREDARGRRQGRRRDVWMVSCVEPSSR